MSSSICSFQGAIDEIALIDETRSETLVSHGDEGIRTPDLLLARQALSHLSYAPICGSVLRKSLSLARWA